MKKTIVILCLAFMIAAVACGSEKTAKSKNAGASQDVYEVLLEQIRAENERNKAEEEKKSAGPTPTPGIAEEALSEEEGIDVDLTKLSSVMVFAEVSNMMMYPELYIGKTVKMTGQFNSLHDYAKDIHYYSCVILDATACCAQGIEFILPEEYKYPEDYPEEGANITVVGTFDTYWEGKDLYCTLRDAKML